MTAGIAAAVQQSVFGGYRPGVTGESSGAGRAGAQAGGEELGPVLDDVLGTDDVAENQGAAGALTGGVMDREGALREVVAGALGPFLTDHYF